MTRRLAFRPRAEADLDDIWAFTVDRWSLAQARAYLTGLSGSLDLLRDHPEIARLHDFQPPVRIFPYRSHLVIFHSDDTMLEVIRILHTRSDWEILLVD